MFHRVPHRALRVDGARIEVPWLDTYSVVVVQLERAIQP
jgi:hypothetical protein